MISLDHMQAHTTVSRTPLDEESVHRRDIYLITQTLYKRNMHVPVEFEPMIPASTRLQMHYFFIDLKYSDYLSVLWFNDL
jgi:hypothetical protein